MNSNLVYALVNILSTTGKILTVGWEGVLFGMMDLIPPYTLTPRFILSMRRLYARNLRGSRGSEIDTAFGLTSASGHGVVASAIIFADAVQNEGLEQSEEIQMEDREIHGAGNSNV